MLTDKIDANWIWKDNEVTLNDFAYFRKKFCISDKVKSAVIKASAHNYFKLFINGTRINGEMSPVPSNPYKSKYFSEYEVNDLIIEGENSIGAIVHYLGGSGQNYVNAFPGFILELSIETIAGSTVKISTDETWTCLKETPYKNNNTYQQNRKISAVELYDSRKEPKGWLHGDFNDTHWDKSVFSLLNNKVIMKKQIMPEGRVEQKITPTLTGCQQIGWQVFDAGKIVSGWVKFTLKGKENLKIRMRYSEDLETNIVKHNVTNESSEYYYDEYIFADKSVHQFKADFSYKAFRYFEITGYHEIINESDIRVECAHTELDERGTFSCSNNLLNDIFQACLQTQKNNTLGQLVDCPHREQAQYLADSDLHFETFGYNFRNPEVIEKLLQDFCDVQQQDGTFPFVYPSNFEHPQFKIKIPEWDLHFIYILWKYYWLYGDITIFDKFYESAKLMLNHYIGRIDESGLVLKSDHWHISDWPYPEVSQNGKYLTIQNCKVYKCLSTMAKIADIINNPEDVEFYTQKAQLLRVAINSKLFDTQRKIYVDSYEDAAASQATNVVALYYGLATEYKENILTSIINMGHTCKTLVSIDLLKLLFENDKSEVAYNMMCKDTYPSWGYMMKQGYKTMWEGFDNIESHCHAWNGYLARVMQEYVLGVKILEKGFEQVLIDPYVPSNLDYAQGSVATTKGDIHVKWSKVDNKINIIVNLPQNITGYLLCKDKKIEFTGNIKYFM